MGAGSVWAVKRSMQNRPRRHEDLVLIDQVISSHPRLSDQEQQALILRAQAGDGEACRELVLSSLRLVVSVAGGVSAPRVDFEDLVQIGTVAVMESVRRFDPNAGTKFSTYAAKLIAWKLNEETFYSFLPVRIPQGARSDLEKERQRECIAPFWNCQSIETTRGHGSADSLRSTMTSRKDEDPSVATIAADEIAKLRRVLGQLPDRQRQAVELRYGIGGGDPLFEREAAEAMGVCRKILQKHLRRAHAAIRAAWAPARKRLKSEACPEGKWGAVTA